MNAKLIGLFFVFGVLLFSGCLLEDKDGTVGVNVLSSEGGKVAGADAVIKIKGTDTVVAEGVTNSEGRWETEVSVGDYTIQVSKEGYENTCLEDTAVGAGRIVISCTLSPEGSEGSEETIEEILAKAENINSLQFILIQPDGTEAQIYQKKEKYRFDTEIKITADSVKQSYNYSGISDRENRYYSYGTEPDWPEFTPFITYDLIELSEKALNDSGLKETGIEAINGKTFRIIEFYLDNQKAKAWVSEEHGLIIKTEFDVEGFGKIEMTMKDVKVNSVDDSVFDVSEYKPFPY